MEKDVFAHIDDRCIDDRLTLIDDRLTYIGDWKLENGTFFVAWVLPKKSVKDLPMPKKSMLFSARMWVKI